MEERKELTENEKDQEQENISYEERIEACKNITNNLLVKRMNVMSNI
jgi:hypothetical protein